MNTVFFAMKIFSFSFVLRFSVSGVCLFLCVPFSLIGCAGSVGISLASRVMYISCMCLRCVECRAGTILFGHFGGVDGGTVRIFLSLWLCSGGYGTVELARGGGPFFLFFLQFAVSSLGGWMSAVGIFVLYIFFW